MAFGRRVILPLLLQVGRPHKALKLSCTFTDATIDPLQENFDIVIRFGALPDSAHLIARRLVAQPRLMCASPSYLRERGTPTMIDELRHHTGVMGSRFGPPLHWIVTDGGVERRLTPNAFHEMGDGEAMVAAAMVGLGICQAPASLLRDGIREGSLVPIMADHTPAPVEVHALWPNTSQLSPKVRYFVDQLVAAGARGLLD